MGKDLAGDAADARGVDDDDQSADGGLGRTSGLSQEMPPAAVRPQQPAMLPVDLHCTRM